MTSTSGIDPLDPLELDSLETKKTVPSQRNGWDIKARIGLRPDVGTRQTSRT